jgi:hypothetical protein
LIRITIRGGTYTLKKLRDILSNRFEKKEDLEKFITAMEQTNQLRKERNRYITKEVREIERTLYPEITTYVYGGPKDIEWSRCGIRGSKEWIDRYGYPTEMHLTRVQQPDGTWIAVKEEDKINIPIVRGRYPEGVEAWRAQIPIHIIKKYGIKCWGTEQPRNTNIRLAITTRKRGFFTLLKLWGYNAHVEQTFDYTKTAQGTRTLELRAEDFAYRTEQNITELQNERLELVKKIKDGWCKEFDPEYGSLFDTTWAEETGRGFSPLEEEPKLTPTVTLYDIRKRTELGKAKIEMPRWYLSSTDEVIRRLSVSRAVVTDRVAHGFKSSRVRKVQYRQMKLGGEGF